MPILLLSCILYVGSRRTIGLMKKKRWIILLLLISSMGVSGCGNKNNNKKCTGDEVCHINYGAIKVLPSYFSR